MTKAERNQRWQEIFDRYDAAMAEVGQHRTLTQELGPLLAQFMANADANAVATDRMAKAMREANQAALALYRDEPEPEP